MEKGSKRYQRFVKIFWGIIIFPVVFLFILFSLIAAGAFGKMPTFEELENPKSNLASDVIASDGKILGKYYQENRTTVDFDEVPPQLVNALIATEDIRFEKHAGIDGKALVRVAWGLLTGNHKGGGSTITQQLAKNLYRMREDYGSSISAGNFIGRAWNLAIMKFKEWVTAVQLERNYTKGEIIVMYLNTVPFGSQAYGIKSAARTFFDKTPDSLNIEEAALLVGVVKGPTLYSPLPPRSPKDSARIRRRERSLLRRNVVISQMAKYDMISEEKADSLKEIPIKLNLHIESHKEGIATYFREYLRTTMTSRKPEKSDYPEWQEQQYKDDMWEWKNNPLYGWCYKHRKPDGSPYNIYKDGLKIYTTINSKMQQYAESAMTEHMRDYLQPTFFKHKTNENAPFSWRLNKKQIDQIMYQSMKRSERYRVLKENGLDSAEIDKNFHTPTEMTVFTWKGEKDTVMTPYDSIKHYKFYLRAGFMSFEPQTGYVRAYVGGIDYKHFKFDHVKIARRQVGSTFKPFIYTMAMMSGISPCAKVMNIPHTILMPEGQPPYTPQFSSSSLNNQMITLRQGLSLSLNQISAWVMKQYTPEAVLDIVRKMGVRSPIDPVPAICVGSAEVKLYEMVGAYGTYANKGFYTRPIFVTRIEDKNGNTISTFKPAKRQVLNEQTAYLMIHMMRGVVQSGTASRLVYKYGFKNEIAGKTGTTNDNADGWFIGITPNLVSGAWVGGEERSIRFSSTALGMGSNMALPIWALYMKKVYADKDLDYSREDRFVKIPESELPVEINCREYEKNSNLQQNQDATKDDFFY